MFLSSGTPRRVNAPKLPFTALLNANETEAKSLPVPALILSAVPSND